MEDDAEFSELLAEAEARPLRGWDLSWLGERMRTSSLPWDYDGIVLRLVQASPDLLDLALAWFLEAAPWVVPGFSLRTQRAGLARLHRQIAAEGPYAVCEPAFFLETLKPRARSGAG